MESRKRSLFAQNLIRIRKLRGFSQYDLAELAGINQRMIAHYEASDTIPPIERIAAIAKALGVNTAQLLEDPSGPDRLTDAMLADADPRTLKKIKEILSLPQESRNILYQVLNELLRKTQLEQEQHAKHAPKRKASQVAENAETYSAPNELED